MKRSKTRKEKNMKRSIIKKRNAILIVVSLAAVSLVSAGLMLDFATNDAFGVFAQRNLSNPYSLSLNNSNAPTSSSSFTDVEHHNAVSGNGYTAFSYTDVKASATGHCVLAEGGTIVKDDASKNLDCITVSINGGKLQIQTGFDDSNFNTTYLIESNNSLGVCGNYIRITALEETELLSLTIDYSCTESSLGHEFGDLIPAASGVPAHYKCEHCDVAFNESKTTQIDDKLYLIKFFDGSTLLEQTSLGINSPVTGPSGTFRTFYDIVGYNAKINGEWDSTLLTSIPNVSGDAEYRIVKQLKADKDYLLSDLSDDGDVLGSSWDYNSDIVKSNVSDIPTGATMSNRETSVLIGTKNGIATIKVGADFFNAVKNNEFDDTDYLQIYAKFPVYASGSKYNDIPMVICKGQWYGFNRSAATDNTGDAVFYNGGSYWLKQLSANGGWQQLKIYVSEIKALLAGVPSSNQREWDSLAFPFARNAASPASSKSREVTVYDVEFHRVDITQDFIINDCTNLAQIRACRNTPKANATNNPVALYDTTVPYNYNGTDYPSGKPTTSLKTGDMALNDPVGTGGWNCQSAVDIGFIVDNIDLFDDNDKVVAYLWGFNFYNGWASISSADDTFADSNNIDMTAGNTTYTKHVSGANHRVWVEATITIAELKALTALKYGTVSANYAHTENIYKAQWLNIHIQCGGVGTPNLVYSVELHHAN